MDIVQASSKIGDTEIDYLTCRQCEASYYNDDNLERLLQALSPRP